MSDSYLDDALTAYRIELTENRAHSTRFSQLAHVLTNAWQIHIRQEVTRLNEKLQPCGFLFEECNPTLDVEHRRVSMKITGKEPGWHSNASFASLTLTLRPVDHVVVAKYLDQTVELLIEGEIPAEQLRQLLIDYAVAALRKQNLTVF